MSEYNSEAKYRPKRYQSIGKLFKKRIPIFSWLPKYDADQAVSDLIAGVTVGLTVMPQGLAYATLAGLEPQVKTHTCIKLTIFSIAFKNFKIVYNNFRNLDININFDKLFT